VDVNKNVLRNICKIERKALNETYISRKSLIISKKIFQLTRNYKAIATYSPYNKEANPNNNIGNKILYFPKVVKGDIFMCQTDKLVKGYKGIREPSKSNCRKIFKKNIGVIIVPGLAFDKKGYRIGYGSGFYDKFLAKSSALKIGVTFDFCVVNKFKHDSHDIRMDIVVTDKKIMFIK